MLICKQGVLHPLPQDSDWSSEAWDGTKAKAREQSKSLRDFNDSKPQTNMEQTTDIDKVAFSKLQIRQSNLKEELLEVTKSLIPPSPMTEAPEDMIENTNGEWLSEAEKSLQREKKSMNCMNKYTWASSVMKERATQILTA